MNIKEKIALLAKEHNTTIRNIEETLGFGRGTISRWSDSSPSIDKLLKVANYFNVNVNVLINNTDDYGYYNDPEVAQLANEIKNDPELRILLDAKRSLSKEDMESVINITKSLLKKERGYED